MTRETLKWIAGGLTAALLALLGWYGASNDRVHGVLFRQDSAADSRLDKLEAEMARLKERVRVLTSRAR